MLGKKLLQNLQSQTCHLPLHIGEGVGGELGGRNWGLRNKYLLCWVLVGSGIESQQNRIAHKLEVGFEPRHPVSDPQGRGERHVCDSVQQDKEGSGQTVFLHLRFYLLQLHLRAGERETSNVIECTCTIVHVYIQMELLWTQTCIYNVPECFPLWLVAVPMPLPLPSLPPSPLHQAPCSEPAETERERGYCHGHETCSTFSHLLHVHVHVVGVPVHSPVCGSWRQRCQGSWQTQLVSATPDCGNREWENREWGNREGNRVWENREWGNRVWGIENVGIGYGEIGYGGIEHVGIGYGGIENVNTSALSSLGMGQPTRPKREATGSHCWFSYITTLAPSSCRSHGRKKEG